MIGDLIKVIESQGFMVEKFSKLKVLKFATHQKPLSLLFSETQMSINATAKKQRKVAPLKIFRDFAMKGVQTNTSKRVICL